MISFERYRLWVGGLCAACLLILGLTSAYAQQPGESIAGRPIHEIIDQFRSAGHRFAYSTSVLTPDMMVVKDPVAEEPRGIVAEILRPYDLVVESVGDLLVVRHKNASAGTAAEAPQTHWNARSPALQELIVSASRYEILRNAISPGVFIDQRQIQQMPVPGDDPLRAVHKIPGAAANGASAKSHIRGSESGDTGIILNGNRLLEPFHVRNFQSLFSAIDSRAVDGIEIYTGSFPVRYGNQMGGLVVIDTIKPTADRHTELGLSVFNTSILSAGTLADSRLGWVASARRGNLDLILDEELGEPSYSDFFGQIEANFSDDSSISFNALIANNDVRLVTESNPSEPEESNSKSRGAQFWINWRQSWNDSLRSVTTASINSFSDHRVESINDPEEMIAQIDDFQEVDIGRLEQHWVWSVNAAHELRTGAEYDSLGSQYDYDGNARYFGTFLLFEDQPQSISRTSRTDTSGEEFSIYASDLWKISENTAAQFGLRWDRQSYTNAADSAQLSPRLGFVHAVSPSTEIRANIGRYYQAQGIHELQIADGIESFFPAQRTDSAVLGIQHRFRNGYSIRGEAYIKRSDRLQPRFENILNQLTVLSEFKPDRVMIAPSKVSAQGIEVSIEQRRSEDFAWWASYVLSSAEDRIGNSDIPRSWDQRHAAQLGLTWSRKKWELGMVATAHSGWPKTSLILENADTSSPVLRFTRRAGQRYDYFATLDMRVRYRTPVHIGYFSFFFELSNMSNRKNPCCVDFDVDTGSGSQPVLELEEKNWLPLLPAAGIRWEF